MSKMSGFQVLRPYLDKNSNFRRQNLNTSKSAAKVQKLTLYKNQTRQTQTCASRESQIRTGSPNPTGRSRVALLAWYACFAHVVPGNQCYCLVLEKERLIIVQSSDLLYFYPKYRKKRRNWTIGVDLRRFPPSLGFGS